MRKKVIKIGIIFGLMFLASGITSIPVSKAASTGYHGNVSTTMAFHTGYGYGYAYTQPQIVSFSFTRPSTKFQPVDVNVNWNWHIDTAGYNYKYTAILSYRVYTTVPNNIPVTWTLTWTTYSGPQGTCQGISGSYATHVIWDFSRAPFNYYYVKVTCSEDLTCYEWNPQTSSWRYVTHSYNERNDGAGFFLI